MRNDLQIIDCDRHVLEPEDIWEKYLDEDFHHHGVVLERFNVTPKIRSLRPFPPPPFGYSSIAVSQPTTPGHRATITSTDEHRGLDRRSDWRGHYKKSLIRNFDNVS